MLLLFHISYKYENELYLFIRYLSELLDDIVSH